LDFAHHPTYQPVAKVGLAFVGMSRSTEWALQAFRNLPGFWEFRKALKDPLFKWRARLEQQMDKAHDKTMTGLLAIASALEVDLEPHRAWAAERAGRDLDDDEMQVLLAELDAHQAWSEQRLKRSTTVDELKDLRDMLAVRGVLPLPTGPEYDDAPADAPKGLQGGGGRKHAMGMRPPKQTKGCNLLKQSRKSKTSKTATASPQPDPAETSDTEASDVTLEHEEQTIFKDGQDTQTLRTGRSLTDEMKGKLSQEIVHLTARKTDNVDLHTKAATPALQKFVARSMNLSIVALGAGGGGDCLFLSIAAGLHILDKSQPEATAEITARTGVPITGSPRDALAKSLRRLVADQLESMTPEDFLNLLITLTFMERSAQQKLEGAFWHDRWSPQQLLIDFGFGDLLAAETVLAVSANEDMGPQDIVVLFRKDNDPHSLPLDNGATNLRALQGAVGDVFSQPGHTHWGTVTDVQMLAVALNVGMIVFSSQDQGQDHWIYGLNCDRGDFPLWMVLYNRSNQHFLLGAITVDPNRPGTTVFPTADLPPMLLEHYNVCNGDAPVGSQYRGGVN
jgi:hypothetical protein